MSALLLAAIPLMSVEARLAKTDAMLMAAILASMYFVARCWKADANFGAAGRAGFYLALSAATLLKGPVVFLVLGATVASLGWVRWSFVWMKPLLSLWGIGLFLALTVPWFAAILIKSDGAFLFESLGKDLLQKAAQGKESHGAPPLTYALAALGTFWPLSAFALLAFRRVRRGLSEASIQFCLAWLLSSWVVFELVPTKLPHYVLPLAPAAALLVAEGLRDQVEAKADDPWARRFLALLFIVPLVLLIGQQGIAIALLGHPLGPAGACLIAAVAIGAWAWRRPVSRSATIALVGGCLASAVFVNAGIFGLTLPRLEPIWLSGRVADAIRADAKCPSGTVVTVGYTEPSLRFLLDRPLRIRRSPDNDADFGGSGCTHLVVTGARKTAVLAAMAAKARELEPVAQVRGVKLNGGRYVEIGIYRHVR